MQKHHRHTRGHIVGQAERADAGPPNLARATALALLPPVIYAAEVKGLIKIGHSTKVRRRLIELQPERLLAFRPGSRSDELSLHRQLAPHCARGREWYHPTPEVMAVVNEMRNELGLELLPV